MSVVGFYKQCYNEYLQQNRILLKWLVHPPTAVRSHCAEDIDTQSKGFKEILAEWMNEWCSTQLGLMALFLVNGLGAWAPISFFDSAGPSLAGPGVCVSVGAWGRHLSHGKGSLAPGKFTVSATLASEVQGPITHLLRQRPSPARQSSADWVKARRDQTRAGEGLEGQSEDS